MHKLGQKLCSALLCLALLAGFFPVSVQSVQAADLDTEDSGYSVSVKGAPTEATLGVQTNTFTLTATVPAGAAEDRIYNLTWTRVSGPESATMVFTQEGSSTKNVETGEPLVSISPGETQSVSIAMKFISAGSYTIRFSIVDSNKESTAPAYMDIQITVPGEDTNVYIGTTELTAEIGMPRYYVVNAIGNGVTEYTGQGIPSSYARLYYDENSGLTLALNNFTYNGAGYSGSDKVAAALYASGDLTIVLTGQSNLTCTEAESAYTNAGVYVNGALTFTGAGDLTASGDDSDGGTSNGIYVSGSIVMAGSGTVAGMGGDSSGDYGCSYGVWTAGGSGSITVESGSLTGTGGVGADSKGVYANKSIEVKGNGSLEGMADAASSNDWEAFSIGVYANRITVQGKGRLTGTAGTAYNSASTPDTSGYFGASAESSGVWGGGGITVRDSGILIGTADAATNNSNFNSATSNGVSTSGESGITIQGDGTLHGTGGRATNLSEKVHANVVSGKSMAVSTGVNASGPIRVQDSGVLTGSGGKAVSGTDRSISRGLRAQLNDKNTPPAMALEGGHITVSGYSSALDLAISEEYEGMPLIIIAETFDYAWRTSDSGSYIQGDYTYNAADTYLEILPASQAVIPVTGVSLNQSDLALTVGGTGTLTVTVSPDNATNPAVSWTSSATGVASVDQNGVVTAVAAGTATITATAGSISDSCTVTVTAPTEPEQPSEPTTPDPEPSEPSTPSRPSTPSEPEEPAGPSTGDSDGWTSITDELDKLNPDTQEEPLIIEMNGETEVPKEIFETIAGKDVDVVFDMGDGVSWSVNGADIPADADLSDLDLGVSMNTSGIPVDVINAITGEATSVQITLAHDGDFGFALTLSAPLGEENAGYWANLYHYDEANEAMDFETASEIESDGTVRLRLTHASQYAIVIDDHSHAPAETTPVSDLFTDVAPDAWYIDAVQYAYDHGLMTGTSATTFEPNAASTRGMIVSILHRLEDSPVVNYLMTFDDVADGEWYAEAVRWAASENIVAGYSDAAFGPNDPITREQLAAILYNYAQWKGMDVSNRADLSRYSDQPSAWANDIMKWAVAEGLISGTSATTLDPQGTATRAQVAAILQRFLEN